MASTAHPGSQAPGETVAAETESEGGQGWPSLGLACTLSRIRSGSIWPAAIIHWGVVVVWKALYAG